MDRIVNDNKWYLDNSGICVSYESMVDSAFSAETQDDLLCLEDDSWWFQYRAEVIIQLMEEYFDKRILTMDVGGGNGYTSTYAQKRGFFTGLIEPSYEACCNAKRRGLKELFCGTLSDEGIIDDSIEQMLLLDVLEHIEDDRSFLMLLRKKMKRKGICLITVPAFMCLWSSEDDAAGHFRRYRLNSLCKLLESCGLEICYKSYFMGFLFIPILIVRVFFERIGLLKRQDERTDEERKIIAESQFKSNIGLVNTILAFFERIELKIMNKQNRVHFGSSIIIVAKKGDG